MRVVCAAVRGYAPGVRGDDAARCGSLTPTTHPRMSHVRVSHSRRASTRTTALT